MLLLNTTHPYSYSLLVYNAISTKFYDCEDNHYYYNYCYYCDFWSSLFVKSITTTTTTTTTTITTTSTHYPLLTTHYSLVTTHYSLLTAHYALLTAHYSILKMLLQQMTRKRGSGRGDHDFFVPAAS